MNCEYWNAKAKKVSVDTISSSIQVVHHPRRPGDPTVLVASSELAKSELGWEPEYRGLDAIIESAWRWQEEHPHGYRSKKI